MYYVIQYQTLHSIQPPRQYTKIFDRIRASTKARSSSGDLERKTASTIKCNATALYSREFNKGSGNQQAWAELIKDRGLFPSDRSWNVRPELTRICSQHQDNEERESDDEDEDIDSEEEKGSDDEKEAGSDDKEEEESDEENDDRAVQRPKVGLKAVRFQE
jgi:hypothetical protein